MILYKKIIILLFSVWHTLAIAAQDYCDANHTSGCAIDFIDGVELNTISNLATGCSAGSYTNYSGISTTLLAGGQYTLYITSGNYTSNYYYAWIDYNDDGDFDYTNEYMGSIHSSDRYQRNSLDFVVPNTSNVTTRLRIGCTYGTTYNESCGAYTYGETEDYEINISQYFGGSMNYLIGLANGYVKPFDFEYDTDLEVFYAGSVIGGYGEQGLNNRIYNDYLSDITVGSGIGAQSASILDYDQDNDLDILAIGKNIDNETATYLFRNSNFSFQKVNSHVIYLIDSRQDCQDFDNDGDMDLLVSGYNPLLGRVSKIYQNSNAEFIEYFSTSSDYGDVGWFDLENDGDFDVIIGNAIYINNNATFTKESTLSSHGGLGIGDYDCDGDMDIALGNKIFRNNITDFSLAFTLDTTTITNNCWGDYDNDGDLDLIHNNTVYQNNDSVFTVTAMTGYTIAENTNQWFDVDYDNDLDIISYIPGSGGLPPGTIETDTNQTSISNSKPSMNYNFASSIQNGEVILSWDPGSDNETPADGLTYNIYIGTDEGIGDIIHPLADIPQRILDPASGRRYVSAPGNVGHNTSWRIYDLPNGTYFWSVQAIDNAYAGSEFQYRQSFTVSDFITEGFAGGSNYVTRHGTILYDFDQDNDLDLFYLGFTGDKYGYTSFFYMQSNNADGSFTNINKKIFDAWGADSSFITVNYDKENDNSPDLFLNNLSVYPDTLWNKDYLVIESRDSSYYKCDNCDSITSLQTGKIDFDNDSDFDALLNDTLFINNNGSLEFFQSIPNSTRSYSWGDFDNDGDLDLVVGDRIYQNYLTHFKPMDFQFQYIADKLTWVDFNFDGYVDIVFCKRNNPSLFQIMINNKNNTFSPVNLAEINTLENNFEFAMGDLDSDFDPDFILNSSKSVPRVGTSPVCKLLSSNFSGFDSPPTAPSNLRVKRDQLDVILQWDEATDVQSTEGHLSYNLRLSTHKDSTNLMSPLSDLETGFLYVPKLGNIQLNKSWRIKNIQKGKYYWSVQAIDQAYNGGPWAPLDSFEVTHVNPEFTWDTVCLNETTHFTNSSATSDTIIAWKWDFDDGHTETIAEPTHLYDTAGIYSVSLWAYTASGDSSWITHSVEVYNIPTASFSVEPVCIGEPSEFINLSDTSTINVTSWEWDFGNGETSTSRTNVSQTYVNTTTATLTIEAENGCTDVNTQTVYIVKNPVINLESDSVLKCPTEEVLFSISNYNEGVDYLWYNNDILMDILHTNNFSGSTRDGEYYVVASLDGCSLESNHVQVANKTAPPNPALYANDGPNEYLIVSSNRNADFYQWYYKGELIPGANEYYHLVYTDYGEYYVELNVDGYDCKARSETIKIPETYTDINNDAFEQILEIYPNPVKDKATLLWIHPYTGKFSIQVFDIMGNLLYTEQNYKTDEEYKQIINLENFVPGIYYIKITSDKFETEKKFVIEK